MRALLDRLQTHLGDLSPPRPVSGGSINQAFRVDSARRGPVFVKHHGNPPVGFFAAEADGLARLAPHVRTPEVIAVWDDALVLEWLPPTASTRASQIAAGHALAALHTQTTTEFGLARDNFMGAIPQDNRASPTFASFFRERRIAPLAHHLPSDLRHRLDRLPLDRVLTDSPPTLTHGDLWSGNLLYSDGPVFIDPAVCYGHPEQDLAMTRLFGGFSDAFYCAYRERSGLTFDAALEARIEFLQLYPLLIHVALFGGGYVDQVAAIVRRFA